jgi:putative ABC transport system substrate-binding protein
MKRVLTLLAVLFAAGMTGRGVMAQRPSGVPHVGVLAPLSPEQNRGAVDDFRAGMRELGWTEGGNVAIEVRYANGDPALASANAAALVAEKVDVIVAISGNTAVPAHRATTTIPIVMDTDNPIGQGLVASLGRPGGNVTGISNMFQEVIAKQLETLKEIAPRVGKIGVLAHTNYAHLVVKEWKPAAASLGVSLLTVGVDTVEELPRRFDEMTAAGADGYLVIADPLVDAMRDTIAALALRRRLPGVAPMRRYADAGVLLSYGPSLSAIHRRQAYFVDRILKGAKPADLPVERPAKFELMVNVKTAKALGLTIPQSILIRADEVIE